MSDLTLTTPVGELIPQLATWEDHITALQKIQEVDGMMNWYRADILLSAIDRFGINSLSELSQVVSLPISTVVTLIRTVKAFPPETRNYAVPFTVHQKASYADSYNEQKKEFIGNERFELLKRAEKEMFSYRDMARAVQTVKEKRALEEGIEAPPKICAYCGKSTGPLYEYFMYIRNHQNTGYSFFMHQSCFADYAGLLKQKRDRTYAET